MKKQNFKNIDLVIVNFYPFEKTVLKTKNENKIIENIDIGGPALVRSAAKNFKDVVVITSNYQLENLIQEMNVIKVQHLLNLEKFYHKKLLMKLLITIQIFQNTLIKLRIINIQIK